MNKLKLLSIIILLLTTGLIISPKCVSAKSGVINLKENKVYKYDLNGDKKKEKIKVINNDGWRDLGPNVDGTYSNIYIYINGKKVYHKRTVGGGIAKFSIADINKKDKYKEIIVCLRSSHAYGTVGLFAFRYKKNKNISIHRFKRKETGSCVFRGHPDIKELNGKVYMIADTPYYSSSFGCYFIYAPLSIKGNRLIALNSTKYKIYPTSKITFGMLESDYTLSRSVNLYEKPSLSSKSSLCRIGTKLTTLYIKLDYKNNTQGNMFVQVKDGNGNKGWIYFRHAPTYRDRVEEILVKKPGWS